MIYTKKQKEDFIDNEIKKAEKFLMDYPNCSQDLKIYYNERIDVLLDIKEHLE